MKRRVLHFCLLTMVGAGLFLFFGKSHQLEFPRVSEQAAAGETIPKVIDPNADITPQLPLSRPPKIVKAVYATGWSAGSESKIDALIDLIKRTELNAIVIDVKDYSGTVSYQTGLPHVNQYGATELRIKKPNALIKKLHDEGIYVIARITIFQDPHLAKARPDLGLKSIATGALWEDQKSLMWVDPAT